MPEVQFSVQEERPKLDISPMLAESTAARARELTCQQYAASLGHSNSNFHVGSNGLPVIQSTIRGEVQAIALKSLHTRLLYLSHRLAPAGHLGQRRICDSVRLEHHGTNMPKDVYTTVDDCQRCVKRGTLMKHQRQITLFFPTGSL